MNDQAKAFRISILLHVLIVAAVVGVAPLTEPGKKLIVLDFDLETPPQEMKKVEMDAPETKAAPVRSADRENKSRKEPPAPIRESLPASGKPAAVTMSEMPSPEISPPQPSIPAPAQPVKEGTPKITGDTGAPRNSESAGGGKDAARTKYLNEHFAYIRDRILRNVNYPDTARRMGWQGRVTLSFIIAADGSVKALKVLQSSGFSLLDWDAMETVRDAAPFPRPPGEAQLVFPVIYRLNQP